MTRTAVYKAPCCCCSSRVHCCSFSTKMRNEMVACCGDRHLCLYKSQERVVQSNDCLCFRAEQSIFLNRISSRPMTEGAWGIYIYIPPPSFCLPLHCAARLLLKATKDLMHVVDSASLLFLKDTNAPSMLVFASGSSRAFF
jgi:hypothetical protein